MKKYFIVVRVKVHLGSTSDQRIRMLAESGADISHSALLMTDQSLSLFNTEFWYAIRILSSHPMLPL